METKDTVNLGISLRDYFAGQWLAGYMANSEYSSYRVDELDAKIAYAAADVMIKARDVEQK